MIEPGGLKGKSLFFCLPFKMSVVGWKRSGKVKQQVRSRPTTQSPGTQVSSNLPTQPGAVRARAVNEREGTTSLQKSKGLLAQAIHPPTMRGATAASAPQDSPKPS